MRCIGLGVSHIVDAFREKSGECPPKAKEPPRFHAKRGGRFASSNQSGQCIVTWTILFCVSRA